MSARSSSTTWGLQARRPTTGATDQRLQEALWAARDVAQAMDRLGYDVLWTAEHHFQREGYECLPNLINSEGPWLATQTERLKFGCAFNILPVSDPAGRRLCDGVSRRGDASSWGWVAATIRARWKRSALPCSMRRPNRELFEEQPAPAQVLQRGRLSSQGQVLRCPPAGRYRGYRLEEITVVPRPNTTAGRDLDADQAARPST